MSDLGAVSLLYRTRLQFTPCMCLAQTLLNASVSMYNELETLSLLMVSIETSCLADTEAAATEAAEAEAALKEAEAALKAAIGVSPLSLDEALVTEAMARAEAAGCDIELLADAATAVQKARAAVTERAAAEAALKAAICLLYTSPSPRDRTRSRMPSSA